ncbi:dihydropyrimidinase [Streptomyces albiaxialis]|uniref:Dihydropyrimidinase n=1 Tax=Streptomyces albiaxialis TaxID=329523 RepID=A0ABN2WPT6_9ACTN
MAAEEYDLVVRGGTLVTAGGSGPGDLGVADGRIVQLGGPMRGRRELDASGAYVLPGAVDTHVHLQATAPGPGDEPGFVDDFASGSRAALAGGVTTLGNMTFPADEAQSVEEAVARDLAAAGACSAVDYVLHPGLLRADDASLAAIPALAAQGHMSIKLFMMSLDEEADPSRLVAAVKRAGDAGMLTLVHCEDGALTRFVAEDLTASGRDALTHYPASRPDFTEAASVERAVAVCRATGAPVCLVHLSSGAALDAARRARAGGLPVYVETRPLYLHLTAEAHAASDGARFVGMPPLRQANDSRALWNGLADGSVDTVATDHAPWFLRDKLSPGHRLTAPRAGVAELETMVPMLYDAGVRTGRLSLERLVAVTATAPARLHGLYPRKGTLAPGADADLLVLDPDEERVIDGAAMESRAGYSVHDGRRVLGWPRFTVSRGEVVYADRTVTARPGRGRWLRRTRTGTPT